MKISKQVVAVVVVDMHQYAKLIILPKQFIRNGGMNFCAHTCPCKIVQQDLSEKCRQGAGYPLRPLQNNPPYFCSFAVSPPLVKRMGPLFEHLYLLIRPAQIKYSISGYLGRQVGWLVVLSPVQTYLCNLLTLVGSVLACSIFCLCPTFSFHLLTVLSSSFCFLSVLIYFIYLVLPIVPFNINLLLLCDSFSFKFIIFIQIKLAGFEPREL